jgi:hypothetical protein
VENTGPLSLGLSTPGGKNWGKREIREVLKMLTGFLSSFYLNTTDGYDLSNP